MRHTIKRIFSFTNLATSQYKGITGTHRTTGLVVTVMAVIVITAGMHMAGTVRDMAPTRKANQRKTTS